ncbi:DMT family transporter [Aliiroseovarius subalbicans]|uniref:DMT family transporter n=1 Tax=Aliiroseovarius subalbicans TaxID=2925840 RepID=UPI001F597EFF|nr:DMT family transporter [Aliiroseovarius subalbicans]MCI2398764.1 DMT family transporter [Aliiroseovarius subalbicans]
MDAKLNMEARGAGALIAIFLILAVNQVVIKVTNDGLQPVFGAALRSLGAVMVIGLWMRFRGVRLDFTPGTIGAGVLAGLIFAAEFICLFVALDLTTVTRVSVIFYSMPVWMALTAHFVLPGERLTPVKSVGLALAFAGVTWAIVDRSGLGGEASLAGDLAALAAALGWMGVSLSARVTRLRELGPEMQMWWQVAVSAPVMLIAALFFGPFVRDFQPAHIAGLAFQIVFVATGAFMAWFWLLKRYKASSVASFAFLSPIFGVAMGWAWLGETVTPSLIGALVLVAVGIVLINRR